jgi:hypothetical protein
MPLQVRRGTNAQRQAMGEPLASGELLYTTDTGTLYIGNGSTLGGVPVANISSQDIKDISAGVFTSGSHSGITFTYDSESGTIDAIVDQDLSNYQGVIRASAFSGSLVADDSSLLVDAMNGSINLNGTVKGNIVPDSNEAYDLGTSGLRFKDLYLAGSSLYLGDAVITSTASVVNLPIGSTVGGVPIGSGSGTGDGFIPGSNYNINIVGDDSTVIVNSSTNELSGTLNGNVVGDLTGTVTGNVIGNVTGDVDSNIFSSFNDVTVSGILSAELTGNVTGTVTGNLIGNVTGDVDSTVFSSFNDVAVSGILSADLTGNVIGTVTGNLIGSSLGTHTGSVIGDLQGSVIADDSSTIVNAATSVVTALSVTGGSVTLTDNKIVTNTAAEFKVETTELVVDYITNDLTFENPKLKFNAARGSLLSPTVVQDLDTLGTISAYGYNGSDYVPGPLIIFAVDDATITTGSTEIKSIIGIGQASELIVASGNYLAIDNVGHTTAPSMQTTGYFQSAVYADPTARDAAITVPASGMMVFLTDSTGAGGAAKFQGYISGTGWVDLN